MTTSPLLDTIRRGELVWGIPIRSPDPAIIEIVAIAGYDWAAITVEHSSLTVREVANLQRAADARGLTTLVHVKDAYDPRIVQLLDEGVGGIVAPHVESAADVEALVRAARFPPHGERGAAGVTRRSDYGAKPYAAYIDEAEQQLVLGVVIETRAGVRNAEQILASSGIDLVYVGLHDLAQSAGIPGDFSNPLLREAIETIVDAARRNDVAVGLSEKGFTIAELCAIGANMIINAPAGEYIALLNALTSGLADARAQAENLAAR